MLKDFNQLIENAKKATKKRLVVVFAHDEHVIEAIKETLFHIELDLILIGDEVKINSMLKQYQIEAKCEVINELDPVKASKLATNLINQNQADILMKGLLDTKIILKAVVDKEEGIRDKKLLSHVGIVEFDSLDRLLFVTDGAMNIYPDFESMLLLIENAVLLARNVGYERPKVGLVSAVEKVNEKIFSTVMASKITDYYQNKGDVGFDIDGPFAIDNLVSEESVKSKKLTSIVAGKADVLIFPNLDSGNIFYKTAVFLADAKAAGLVIGAKVPIVLTSRADSALTKFFSIILAVVYQDGLFNLSN